MLLQVIRLLCFYIPFLLIFYALVTLAIVLFVILTNWNIGPMKYYEQLAKKSLESSFINTSVLKTSAINTNEDNNNQSEAVISSPLKMLLPLLIIIATIPIALYLSGKGNMLEGSGSTAVFYAVVTSLSFHLWLLHANQNHEQKRLLRQFLPRHW